jgi:hypothetical protein
MTEQEIFNKTWQHFIVEKNKKSFADSIPSKCVYRQDRTGGCKTRCAVGLFIPDEDYSPDMDNGDIPNIETLADVAAQLQVRRYFLEKLQETHDTSTSNDQFFHEDIENNLRIFADSFDLIIPNENSL